MGCAARTRVSSCSASRARRSAICFTAPSRRASVSDRGARAAAVAVPTPVAALVVAAMFQSGAQEAGRHWQGRQLLRQGRAGREPSRQTDKQAGSQAEAERDSQAERAPSAPAVRPGGGRRRVFVRRDEHTPRTSERASAGKRRARLPPGHGHTLARARATARARSRAGGSVRAAAVCSCQQRAVAGAFGGGNRPTGRIGHARLCQLPPDRSRVQRTACARCVPSACATCASPAPHLRLTCASPAPHPHAHSSRIRADRAAVLRGTRCDTCSHELSDVASGRSGKTDRSGARRC